MTLEKNGKSEYVPVSGHKMHIFTAGNENGQKLVFMAGSGTAAPVYDFKILYGKLADAFRIIVIEKFGYGSSDLYEGPCDIDSLVGFQRQALKEAGEAGPYILLPHSMSGIEAIRWRQKYPGDVEAVIGLDMAVPQTYIRWSPEQVEKRILLMKRMRRLLEHGLLFWFPLNTRGLTEKEIRAQRKLWKRNAFNSCYAKEAQAVRQNAAAAAAGGRIDCPLLMFVSDGKQVSAGWIENAKQFAMENSAETVFLDCGHYIHYYESEKISRKIREFTAGRTVK